MVLNGFNNQEQALANIALSSCVLTNFQPDTCVVQLEFANTCPQSDMLIF